MNYYHQDPPPGTLRSRQKMQQLGTKTNTDNEKQTDIIIKDDAGYADDAAIFIENDTREQMRERMGKYDTST